MKKLLFILSLPFVLFSCKKDTASPNAKPMHSTAKAADCDPSNPENPYDSKGAQHNVALDYLINSSIKDPKGIMAAAVQKWPNKNLRADYMDQANWLTAPLPSGNQNPQDVANRTNLSPLGKQYYIQLANTVSDASVYDDNSTYCDYKNRILTVENTIMNDSKLESPDKQTLLGACAVARYSGYYNLVQNPPVANPSNSIISFNPRMLLVVRVDMDAYDVLGDENAAGACSTIAWGIVMTN